jgi:hypothetical protein
MYIDASPLLFENKFDQVFKELEEIMVRINALKSQYTYALFPILFTEHNFNFIPTHIHYTVPQLKRWDVAKIHRQWTNFLKYR